MKAKMDSFSKVRPTSEGKHVILKKVSTDFRENFSSHSPIASFIYITQIVIMERSPNNAFQHCRTMRFESHAAIDFISSPQISLIRFNGNYISMELMKAFMSSLNLRPPFHLARNNSEALIMVLVLGPRHC